MMENNSFVFYQSWLEAIKNLPREHRVDAYEAILEYGLLGASDGELKPIAKAMLTMAKGQIDINKQRRENGEKGAEHGKKGGNPNFKKGQSNPYYDKGKDNPEITPTLPRDNPEITPDKKKITPNVNVNVNDNNKHPPNNAHARDNFSGDEGMRPPAPTLDEVKQCFRSLRANERVADWEECAERFFYHYDGLGWRNSNGAIVANWKSTASFWLYEQESRDRKEQQKQQSYGKDSDNRTSNRQGSGLRGRLAIEPGCGLVED